MSLAKRRMELLKKQKTVSIFINNQMPDEQICFYDEVAKKLEYYIINFCGLWRDGKEKAESIYATYYSYINIFCFETVSKNFLTHFSFPLMQDFKTNYMFNNKIYFWSLLHVWNFQH